MVAAHETAIQKWFLMVLLKASLRKLYGRHHDFVVCYNISVSQNITGMFLMSLTKSRPLFLDCHFIELNLSHKVCDFITLMIRNTTSAILGTVTVFLSETPRITTDVLVGCMLLSLSMYCLMGSCVPIRVCLPWF